MVAGESALGDVVVISTPSMDHAMTFGAGTFGQKASRRRKDATSFSILLLPKNRPFTLITKSCFWGLFA